MVFSVSWVTVYGVHGLLLLFSISSVQSSIQLSVGFRVYSVQYQFSACSVRVCTVQWVILGLYSSESVAFSVSSVSVALGCVLFSGSFSVCTLQGLQRSEHWLFSKSLSCSCRVPESTL